jgi:hypothetical protein
MKAAIAIGALVLAVALYLWPEREPLAKADSLAEYVGMGETAISKLIRAPKIMARLDPRECPQGYRDIMEMDGSIGGCIRDRGGQR